jgi:hypothetical protein
MNHPKKTQTRWGIKSERGEEQVKRMLINFFDIKRTVHKRIRPERPNS